MLSHRAYQCTPIFRNGSTLAGDCDWLQSPTLPYPILCSPSLRSFSFSLPSALCPALPSACASGGRRWGEGEGEESSLSPGPRTRWEKAQLFSFALCSWTPEKPAPRGSTSVHSCQSSASEQHNYQCSAIPAKTSQWYRSLFPPLSFPS